MRTLLFPSLLPLLLLVLGGGLRGGVARDVPFLSLVAGQEAQGDMRSPGESRDYMLVGLQPDTTYEIRVSYPAVFPTDFTIEFVREDTETEASPGRRLSNTEKFVFRTDSTARVLAKGAGSPPHVVRVSLRHAGVAVTPDLAQRPVPFTIVMEPLLVGLPPSALRLAMVGIPLLLAAFWWLGPHLPAFVYSLGAIGWKRTD